MPALGNDGRAAMFDDEEFPLEEEEDEPFDPERLMYGFDLWLPSVLDGWPYQVGEGSLVIAVAPDRSSGGDPTAGRWPSTCCRTWSSVKSSSNPNAKGAEAWAWLPPPLIGEGRKVQPAWLHDYLLDPRTSFARPS